MRITRLENSKLHAKLLSGKCVRPINKIIYVTMQLCRKSVNLMKIQTLFKKESVEKETKEH